MTTDNALAIEATGLVKSFGETRAVDGVDLAVRSGSVYGVLGPTRARRACWGTTSCARRTPCAAS
jgi:ABC-2 type transport system ATP-binding protein